MKQMYVTVDEMTEEIAAMLEVCFEGENAATGNQVLIVLPNGQKFRIAVAEDA